MALNLKKKIALGGIFLFALLILVGGASFYYLNRITTEAKAIVKNNYETLHYSREMLKEIDELSGRDSTTVFTHFEQNLQLQERNITEPGEREQTESLRKHFDLLKSQLTIDSLKTLIRKDISAIMQLNLQAIDKKNQAAQRSAESAKTTIILILTLCLLFGFTFVFNFPSLIASPISKLTEGIKAIADKNYGERIHLNRNDEFGELANAFNTMAERLDEYEHSNLSRILFEKKRAETVINSLKDASVGIDSKGVVLFANEQALQLLNLKETEIVGMARQEVQKKNDLFRFLITEQGTTPFKIVVEGKENYFIKEVIDIPQGEERAGSVLVLKNITSFKELDVAKTNFIATISHELKTPLASSDFSLKLLSDNRTGKLNAEQAELVEQLKGDNQRMLKILSELLNMSQVESGKIQLEITEARPETLVDMAIASVMNVARERNVHIRKEIPESLPAIRADADKTIWVINNFLTNAVRYSPPGSSITIEVQPKSRILEFSVQDEGSGVDPKYLDKIFDRYFKIPGTKEGTGLGLAISKEFIEAQGGSIKAESELGHGSRFSFTLNIVS
ncbi:MAG: ATP-binding protein [Ferruginibacter sp.]